MDTVHTLADPFLTPADLLARGLDLPAVAESPYVVDARQTCAITGQPLGGKGYRVADMTTPATAEFLDCFRGGVDGYVSENAARCFRSANPRTGNPCARSHLVFADGTYFGPLISRESAVKLGRPCWSDLVRSVWPARAGETCLVMVTTDQKKRLWINARVGALGPRTPVYVHDGETAQNGVVLIDWPSLLACLDVIEEAYTAGFPKAALRNSLYAVLKIAGTVGLATTRRHERALRAWRGRPEFVMAMLIAQKREEGQNARDVRSDSSEAGGADLRPAADG